MEVKTIIPAKKRLQSLRKKGIGDLRSEILNGKSSPPVVPEPSSAPVVIEARPEIKKKIRVASYCRVSTGSLQQETSLKSQREHYEQYIKSNPDWEFAGIYWEADESGTDNNRPELQRLIADCKRGAVDLILTKSISRFSRNTSDCLEMVRTLTGLGIDIVFEKENLHTGTMGSEFLLTIFSSFAAEESRSISENEKWGIKKRFENGTFRYSRAPYGYTLVDGAFVINPEQAQIVREIFDASLSGKGTMTIAKELQSRGIPTGTKKFDGSPGVWSSHMVGGIIKNVVYIGDLLCQKTYRDNFHLKINYGEKQQYYNEGHHEPIISREVFEAANAAVRQRGKEKGNVPVDRHLRQSPHSNRYAFSGKLQCACCGGKMKRITQTSTQGARYHWACVIHLSDKGQCPMKRELEDSIKNAFSTMMNKLVFSKGIILDLYAEEVRSEEMAENKEEIRALEQKLKGKEAEKRRLGFLHNGGCCQPAVYHQKIAVLEAEEVMLEAEINRLKSMSQTDIAVGEMKKQVDEWKRGGGNPDEFFPATVEKADVMTGQYVDFYLKCGLVLRESLEQ